MAFCASDRVRFCLVLLCAMSLTFSVSSAIRIDDIIRGTVKHIPLKRNQPYKFGFFREADFERFDKEMVELHNDRLKRSVEDSVQQSNHSIIHEFELKGDNHSVAFLHWAGKKSSVIYIYTCGKIKNTQSDHFLCEDAYFWRSSDYGSTFHRKENQFQGKNGTVTINNVDFCNSNNKKVIVSALSPSTLFISLDQGSNFIQVPVGFKPHVISCNPQSDQMIIGHDVTSDEVHYSTDGGSRWKLLAQNVVKHSWGYGSKSEVILEVQTHTPLTSVLKHAYLNPDSVEVKTFDKALGTFMKGSFEVAGRYMLVQKHSTNKGLYVFYKENSSSRATKNFFQRARFPLQQIEEKAYKVVDASESELMVVVKHGKGFYNLYTSDETGVKFSLSLERILSNRTLIWGKPVTLVDLHKVQSLNGTYLANVVVRNRYVRSVVTYNKGGSWHLLRAPYQDHNGRSTHCSLPYCSLHIHIVLSHWRYYIPGVLSSSSAVGIIVAQGNLGTRLGQRSIGVFMSNDGGLTWTKEFDRFYDFVIGDHGGILAAVSLWFGTKKVWYSCTEGKEWKSIPLDNQVKVYGMVTEPGETKLIVNLFGQYDKTNFQWLSVKLNFTTVLNRKCQQENYTRWSPNDERVGYQCLLGQHIVYQRRKSGDCCFNGEEYEREINVTACTCTTDDFDCDFGYEDPDFDEICRPTSYVELVPNPCPEGKTYKHSSGYRKVVGDRCEGGVENAFKPKTRFCPITVPDELSIQVIAKHKRAFGTSSKVIFALTQKKGSTKTTQYSWDFGDGSPLFNATGFGHARSVPHVFKSNGHYVVTVRAVNKAGQASISTSVTVLDPIKSVVIDPPYAVVVGEEAWFNATFYTIEGPDPEQYKPSYGYVHFMWTFDNVSLPTLTWAHTVSHVFSATGKFLVEVQAISLVSSESSHVLITVYDDLTTVRLSLDVVLDAENADTREWRTFLAQRLQAFLSYELLDIQPSRLEVVVLPGTPTKADVSITPAPTNTSKTRDEIVALLKEEVAEGKAEMDLSHITVKITYVEKLPDRVIDGCKSAPCKNGGICKTDNGTFTCKCHAGFTGHLCETDIDECKSPSPCKNGGTCVNEHGSYTCNCSAGFTGKLCEKDIDECKSPSPCKNGGTCVNEHGSYTCNCSAGFTGKLCEKDIDECKSPSPCKNGGTCVNEHGSYTCNCSAGFTGKLCKKGHENYIDDSFGKKPGNTQLLIAVSITASLVVIFLILALIYFLRRYKRLQSRYTHLRLYGDGGELRDREPLLGDETETEDEEALHPQPGGTQRYIPIPTSTEPDPYSDDELINNFQPWTLTFKPSDQNGQAPEETPNSQTQV
ncbi:VPS10 domain-containing receptor SorCS1-like isoform X2 [Montipora capricornis]|uniref:VPS10 domain-containing receptor SorCS1-like isoform X2 n=1 Tax=Montipora capricornis TaxID=246305 RepID=UPI0035F16495